MANFTPIKKSDPFKKEEASAFAQPVGTARDGGTLVRDVGGVIKKIPQSSGFVSGGGARDISVEEVAFTPAYQSIEIVSPSMPSGSGKTAAQLTREHSRRVEFIRQEAAQRNFNISTPVRERQFINQLRQEQASPLRTETKQYQIQSPQPLSMFAPKKETISGTRTFVFGKPISELQSVKPSFSEKIFPPLTKLKSSAEKLETKYIRGGLSPVENVKFFGGTFSSRLIELPERYFLTAKSIATLNVFESFHPRKLQESLSTFVREPPPKQLGIIAAEYVGVKGTQSVVKPLVNTKSFTTRGVANIRQTESGYNVRLATVTKSKTLLSSKKMFGISEENLKSVTKNMVVGKGRAFVSQEPFPLKPTGIISAEKSELQIPIFRRVGKEFETMGVVAKTGKARVNTFNINMGGQAVIGRSVARSVKGNEIIKSEFGGALIRASKKEFIFVGTPKNFLNPKKSIRISSEGISEKYVSRIYKPVIYVRAKLNSFPSGNKIRTVEFGQNKQQLNFFPRGKKAQTQLLKGFGESVARQSSILSKLSSAQIQKSSIGFSPSFLFVSKFSQSLQVKDIQKFSVKLASLEKQKIKLSLKNLVVSPSVSQQGFKLDTSLVQRSNLEQRLNVTLKKLLDQPRTKLGGFNFRFKLPKKNFPLARFKKSIKPISRFVSKKKLPRENLAYTQDITSKVLGLKPIKVSRKKFVSLAKFQTGIGVRRRVSIV